MPQRPPPTAEQLRLAFRQVSRPGWPTTLEAALAHPVYGVCLRGMACTLDRRGMDRAPTDAAQALRRLMRKAQP